MIIRYEKGFKKQFKKLPERFQRQFTARLHVLLADPTHPALRVHPLKGEYAGYWSMNVNGDIRALYFMESNEIVIFVLIGSHSQLYG